LTPSGKYSSRSSEYVPFGAVPFIGERGIMVMNLEKELQLRIEVEYRK
jgi:hypothetical protein